MPPSDECEQISDNEETTLWSSPVIKQPRMCLTEEESSNDSDSSNGAYTAIQVTIFVNTMTSPNFNYIQKRLSLFEDFLIEWSEK